MEDKTLKYFKQEDFEIFKKGGQVKQDGGEINVKFNDVISKIKSLHSCISNKLDGTAFKIKSMNGIKSTEQPSRSKDNNTKQQKEVKYVSYVWLKIYIKQYAFVTRIYSRNSKKHKKGEEHDDLFNVYNLSFSQKGISICLDYVGNPPLENTKKNPTTIEYTHYDSYAELANVIIQYCTDNKDKYIENFYNYQDIKNSQLPQNPNDGETDGDAQVDESPLNLILYGPPGTGKTHCTVDKALERLLPKHELDSLNAITPKDDKRKAQEEKFNELKKQGRIVFTTFHQSMSYEDFIEGIKPETDDDGNVTYEVKPGIFKQLCEKAKLSQTSSNFNEAYNTFINDLTSAGNYGNNPSKFVTSNKSTFGISVNSKGNLSLFTGNPLKKQGTITKDNLELRFLGNSNYNYWESYFKRIIEHLEDRYQLQQENRPNNNNYVLIIDEINRGNVANIFGELITLIEDNKRGQQRVKVTLPYSHDDFSVPENLYIIGTMNTADRSVEALDTALRRRFSFEEMMPKYDLAELEKEVCDHKLSDILRTINSRIEVLKDRDHLIGHSYLMKVNDENDLKSVFFDKIIPLLQEYFYGDYEKILMVLGDGFVKEETPKVAFAGNRNYDFMPDKVYHIADNNNIDMTNALESMKIHEWEKSKAEVILENPEDKSTNLSNDSEQD